FNNYTPSQPVGYVICMDLVTNELTIMTRALSAGWADVFGGDLAEAPDKSVRVRGLTDGNGNSYPITGTFTTGDNDGFLRFNGSNFQTATPDTPPQPFNIIESASDMVSYFGNPSGN